MKMMIETTSAVLAEKTIAEIVSQANVEADSIFYFDSLDESGLKEAAGEYLASSFLEDKKLIVIRNFTAFKNKGNAEKEVLHQLDKIFAMDTENILIFVTEKLNRDNKYYSEHKEEVTVFKLDVPQPKDLVGFVTNNLKEKEITIKPDAAKHLVDIVEGDFDNLVNELKKLHFLDEEVDIDLLNKTVYDRKGESVFTLIDSIFKKDVDNITYLVDKMKEQDIAVFQIVTMLINDLSYMILIKKLEMEYAIQDVKDMLKLNPYRFSKMSNTANKYTREELMELLDNLINLEIKLKSYNSSDIYRIFKAKLVT